jgi:hypothetical protein
VSRAVVLAIALAVLALRSRPSPAQNRPTSAPATASSSAPRLVAILPDARGDLAAATLVGRSAELYEPVATGLQRRAAGGVAPDVQAVVRGGDGTLWAIPVRAPPFRRSEAGWQAVPLGNRGSIAVAVGAPRFAIGRHVYELEKAEWRHRFSAPARVVRLAASGEASFLALGDGRVFRHDGKRLTPLELGLVSGETIAALFADKRGALVGTSTGRWLRPTGAAKPKPLTVPAELTGLAPLAGAADGASSLVLGAITAADGARRDVLVRIDGERLTAVETLPAAAAGDGYVALALDRGGTLLVATGGGQVRRRRPGGAWTDVPVLPDALPVHEATAQKAPGRSR